VIEQAFEAALEYHRRGRIDLAEPIYRAILNDNPRHAGANHMLGMALRALGRLDEAVSAYQRAIKAEGKRGESHFNLGNVFVALGRHADAVQAFERAANLMPNDPEAVASLAAALRETGAHEAALGQFRRAIELAPGKGDLHNDLANLLAQRGDAEGAAQALRHALELAPEDPDIHHNLARLLLARGEVAQGWNEYRWRARCKWFQAYGREAGVASPWSEALRGRPVVLHGEQGLGDQLFFLRFAPRLKALGAGPLAVNGNPRLNGMLARTRMFSQLTGEAPAGALELLCGELPWLTGLARAEDIPAPLPLAATAPALAAMREVLARAGPPPYLGVTWRAGVRGRTTLSKEIEPEPLAAVLRAARGTVVLLQREGRADDQERFRAALGRPAPDLSGESEDLERLLALLALLDDYVGVSSTNMHLRAGLGRAARVLVPMPPDWRWMAAGEASPWFPGFAIYRQDAGGSWSAALARLAGDIL
jgi:tetratricopeptide (TPR) repeat protein